MRKILLWLVILVFTASLAPAQDAATQQQIDQLNGKLQDLIDAQAAQGKRLEALEKQIAELTDKVSTPAVSDSASREDLKKLAEQVQEIDKKRQADNDLVLEQLKKLAKISPVPGHKSPPLIPKTSEDNPTPGTAAPSGTSVPQKGYDYPIASGDTISAIAKAYRAQGVKVNADQILKANPGLNPNSLIVGKKIFIPDPNAK
jgi:LysM repeat protein